jgi:hypothetical protein
MPSTLSVTLDVAHPPDAHPEFDRGADFGLTAMHVIDTAGTAAQTSYPAHDLDGLLAATGGCAASEFPSLLLGRAVTTGAQDVAVSVAGAVAVALSQAPIELLGQQLISGEPVGAGDAVSSVFGTLLSASGATAASQMAELGLKGSLPLVPLMVDGVLSVILDGLVSLAFDD